ncbi:hypothetical protein V7S43_015233 [Phytophthora oleae]|uniref:Uncharacterized protein n=1 Tax=Phytophthora oleae TaxID=2107226 RepID=A0ABD3F1R9_9STRA
MNPRQMNLTTQSSEAFMRSVEALGLLDAPIELPNSIDALLPGSAVVAITNFSIEMAELESKALAVRELQQKAVKY